MTPNHFSFSVILATYNEESRIEYVLRNFAGRAHMLVIDNYSTDGTVEIARRYTDHVCLRKNPGYLTPDYYEFGFREAPTNYVLMGLAGQIHPVPLIECYDRIAREGKFKAVGAYNRVLSYGSMVNSYSRPYARRSAHCKFFDKRFIDLSRSAIHDEQPFTGTRKDIWFPPRRPEYCIVSFRDDTAEATELKHARYGNADAQQRFAQGERTNWAKMFWVFNRHLWGCLLWRGAIWQGMPGWINCIWRACYFLNIQIRLWEMEHAKTRETVMREHAKLKEEMLGS